MNINKIAESLVSLLRQGKFEEAQKSLFSQEVTSIEPDISNIPPVKGIEAVLDKGKAFRESVESWHGITVSDPIISKDFFAISLKVDLTFKGQDPSSMDELIVFKVEDREIILEKFYY